MDSEPNATVGTDAMQVPSQLDSSWLSLDPQKDHHQKQLKRKRPDKQVNTKIKQALSSRKNLVIPVILKDLTQFCLWN